jgi:preprotein translocase subunit SecG
LKIFYDIVLGLGIFVALLFSALVLATGKGDAMSGGGGIRTTYKGKASFDDHISKWTLILGASFMALMLAIDILGRAVSPLHS